MKALYDYHSATCKNEITGWAKSEHLSSRDRGILEQRLGLLAAIDRELALGTKLLNGPLRKSGNLYKLKASGEKQMRPHLCSGPVNHGAEYTILAGAIERDGQLHPGKIEKLAIGRRGDVATNPEERRGLHEKL